MYFYYPVIFLFREIMKNMLYNFFAGFCLKRMLIFHFPVNRGCSAINNKRKPAAIAAGLNLPYVR